MGHLLLLTEGEKPPLTHRRPQERAREMSHVTQVQMEMTARMRTKDDGRRPKTTSRRRASLASAPDTWYMHHENRPITDRGGARGFELPVRNSVHTEIHVWILHKYCLLLYNESNLSLD